MNKEEKKYELIKIVIRKKCDLPEMILRKKRIGKFNPYIVKMARPVGLEPATF